MIKKIKLKKKRKKSGVLRNSAVNKTHSVSPAKHLNNSNIIPKYKKEEKRRLSLLRNAVLRRSVVKPTQYHKSSELFTQSRNN